MKNKQEDKRKWKNKNSNSTKKKEKKVSIMSIPVFFVQHIPFVTFISYAVHRSPVLIDSMQKEYPKNQVHLELSWRQTKPKTDFEYFCLKKIINKLW